MTPYQVSERLIHWWDECCKAHNRPDMIATPPKLRFSNKMTRAAGKARCKSNLIIMSNYYLSKESDSFNDETIGHEVAHIFCYRYYGYNCKHNPLWKRCMVAIGLPPKRCHNSTAYTPRRQDRFRYQCRCGRTYGITQNIRTRMSNGRKYRCTSCRAPLTLESIESQMFAPIMKGEFIDQAKPVYV
jgi:SprT protein